jgi:hypothetical protein
MALQLRFRELLFLLFLTTRNGASVGLLVGILAGQSEVVAEGAEPTGILVRQVRAEGREVPLPEKLARGIVDLARRVR